MASVSVDFDTSSYPVKINKKVQDSAKMNLKTWEKDAC